MLFRLYIFSRISKVWHLNGQIHSKTTVTKKNGLYVDIMYFTFLELYTREFTLI